MAVTRAAAVIMGISAAGAACAQAPAASGDDPFIRGIKQGKLLLDVRMRYETVDDHINDDAEGLTVRTRLGYETAPMGGFRLLGEFTDTRSLFGLNDYAPEQPGYATIADPGNTELNRAVVSYEGWKMAWLGVGRQRIILDNARWVGNVGWRQKEQTYDAGSVDLTFGGGWKLSYDYLERVQGITPAFNADVSDHLVNLSYGGWRAGTLTAYGYLLEDDDSDDERNTYGLRFSGSTGSGALKWLYTAEYAHQTFDPGAGGSYGMDYYTLQGGIGFKAVTIQLAYEVLGSDGGEQALQTPLATKFAFNGWADLFLTTPADGLRDAFVSLGANWLGLNWQAIYHDFRADDGGGRYGDEVDLHISKAFGKHYQLGAKYARYDAEDFKKDRDKFWLWFELKV